MERLLVQEVRLTLGKDVKNHLKTFSGKKVHEAGCGYWIEYDG
jgi:hypothetical protein